ncbi:MAG: hypothetical protein ACKOX1_10130 [Ignavibacteria bacterium]
MKNLFLFLLGIHTVFVMGCMTPTPSSLRQLNRYHANTSDKKYTVVHHFEKEFSIVYVLFNKVPLTTPDVNGYLAEQVALHYGDGVINLNVETESPFLLNLLISTLSWFALSGLTFGAFGGASSSPGGAEPLASASVALALVPLTAAGLICSVGTFTLYGDIIKYKE